MTQRGRGGFSLMEVMLATSILLGSSIVLVELAAIGRKQANTAYELNIAQLLCQAKLDEIVAGVSSAAAVSEVELEDNPGWLFTVESYPMPRHGLVAIRVSVFQEPQEFTKPVRFSLVRWLPDTADTTSDAAPGQNFPSPPRPNRQREESP